MKLNFNFAMIVFAIGILMVSSSTEAQTIADAKAAGIGVGVTIENVTITNLTDLVENPDFINFHVRDSTGAITIFGDTTSLGAAITGFAVGDVVNITGVTDEFAGLFEIDETEKLPPPFSMTDTGKDDLPVDPIMIVTDDLLDMSPTAEGVESALALLENVTFESGGPSEPGSPFVGSANYQVSDGTNTVTARIATTATALELGNVPEEPVSLIGIVGQFTFDEPFNTGYQLQVLAFASDCLVGDVNMDGEINLLDVQPFIALLASGEFQCEADIDGNGVINLLDVAPFIDLIAG